MKIYGPRRALRELRTGTFPNENAQRLHDYLDLLAVRLFARPSVFFFALHRGGSTLLAETLRKATDLRHMNYESMIWAGEHPKLRFYRRGHLYGSLRLSVHLDSELLAFARQPGFARGRHSLVMIRDPRDILVSRYHSFGYSHGFSANPELRAEQEIQMAQVRAQGIDEYVLSQAAGQVESFRAVRRVIEESRKSVLVKYEEMIADFESFSAKVRSMIEFPDDTMEWLYRESRPRVKEDPTVHRRSGRTGSYVDHLAPATVDELNRILGRTLEEFDYL